MDDLRLSPPIWAVVDYSVHVIAVYRTQDEAKVFMLADGGALGCRPVQFGDDLRGLA